MVHVCISGFHVLFGVWAQNVGSYQEGIILIVNKHVSIITSSVLVSVIKVTHSRMPRILHPKDVSRRVISYI
jgi:hypothetical protein